MVCLESIWLDSKDKNLLFSSVKSNIDQLKVPGFHCCRIYRKHFDASAGILDTAPSSTVKSSLFVFVWIPTRNLGNRCTVFSVPFHLTINNRQPLIPKIFQKYWARHGSIRFRESFKDSKEDSHGISAFIFIAYLEFLPLSVLTFLNIQWLTIVCAIIPAAISEDISSFTMNLIPPKNIKLM